MALPSGARGYFCFYFFIFSCMLIQLPQISLQLLSCLRIYTSERHFISLINLFSWLPRLGWNAAPLKLTFITTRRTAPGPPRSPTFSSTGAGPCLYFSAYIRMWCQHGISDGPPPLLPPTIDFGSGAHFIGMRNGHLWAPTPSAIFKSLALPNSQIEIELIWSGEPATFVFLQARPVFQSPATDIDLRYGRMCVASRCWL